MIHRLRANPPSSGGGGGGGGGGGSGSNGFMIGLNRGGRLFGGGFRRRFGDLGDYMVS
jgi:hypothetical protein